MFQYAASRALAEKRGTQVILDLTWYDQEFGPRSTARTYELSCFRLRRSSRSAKSKLALRAASFLAKRYEEPHFHFDPGFFHLPRRTVLQGYFQSEKYFRDIREILLQEFAWTEKPQGQHRELLREIQQNEASISLHVRRGDYITHANVAEIHGSIGVGYYGEGMDQLAREVDNPRFYLFSDEPDWCRQNLKFSHPTTYVPLASAGSEDLRLMKACRHNIIANSSFSWWGAWLNENPRKIVVAPKKWFSRPDLNTRDILPESWRRL